MIFVVFNNKFNIFMLKIYKNKKNNNNNDVLYQESIIAVVF